MHLSGSFGQPDSLSNYWVCLETLSMDCTAASAAVIYSLVSIWATSSTSQLSQAEQIQLIDSYQTPCEDSDHGKYEFLSFQVELLISAPTYT